MSSNAADSLSSVLVFPQVPEDLQTYEGEDFDFMELHNNTIALVKNKIDAEFPPATNSHANYSWNSAFKAQKKWVREELPKFYNTFQSLAKSKGIACDEYTSAWDLIRMLVYYLLDIRHLQAQLELNKDKLPTQSRFREIFVKAYNAVHAVVKLHDAKWMTIPLDEGVREKYRAKVEDLVLDLGTDMYRWKIVLRPKIEDKAFGTDKGAEQILKALENELASEFVIIPLIRGIPFADIVGWTRVIRKASSVLDSVRAEVESDAGLSKHLKFMADGSAAGMEQKHEISEGGSSGSRKRDHQTNENETEGGKRKHNQKK